jgi:serine/threonine protein kinase
LSLEKDSKEIMKRFGFRPAEILNREISGYTIDRLIGYGQLGVVFRGVDKEVGNAVAVKVIPRSSLKDGWELELKKLKKLRTTSQVVQFEEFSTEILTSGMSVACILYQFIDGDSLLYYAKANPELITLEFVEELIIESLKVFKACKTSGIQHGDFHVNNIIVAKPDDRQLNPRPKLVFSDFGIGFSKVKSAPSNDYQQLSKICIDLIHTYIDPAKLNGEERYIRDRLLDDYLPKQLAEKDPTVGDYVQNPDALVSNLIAIHDDYTTKILRASAKLHKPFDYLSCEQIGDSFELLRTLYTKNFPGYEDLLERANTLLTGPRGCGKSTIFRNLSYKTQLLAKKSPIPDQFIGIYYNCNDLYYAFPYNISLNEKARKCITHYFNLSILTEIFDTFAIYEETFQTLPQAFHDKLQRFLGSWFKTNSHPRRVNSVFRYLLSQVIEEKEEFRALMAKNGFKLQPALPLPEDFIQKLCHLIQSSIPWLNDKPFYFFLDDYSLPRVSREVQATLNSFILTRNANIFFKISTESIVSIYPYDARNKLLEQSREYDTIDLGDYFLFSDSEKASAFLREIVNNRLKNAVVFPWESKDIKEILEDSEYSSYNELAVWIKDGKHVEYSGWDTVVQLCSGDIANVLRLIRNMFTIAESEGCKNKIPRNIQNRVIRETGNDFLNKIESVQDTGRQLRKIVQAFGVIANHYLKTRTSKNQDQEPQMQASRIEIRETPYFEKEEPQGKISTMNQNAKKYYDDLIKYGIFIRDVRGKSIRGAVVPRLYMRRLLIPTFVLTPSKRDSLSLEVRHFTTLLCNPDEFVRIMKNKSPRRKRKMDQNRQKRLPS